MRVVRVLFRSGALHGHIDWQIVAVLAVIFDNRYQTVVYGQR